MMRVRKATLEDVELINILAEEIFNATYQDILSPEQLEYMFDMMYSPKNIETQMQELGHQYFIAYHEENPVGYLSVEQQGEQLFHLQKIYILPKCHGKGMGKELIEYAFNYAKSVCKYDSCTVELNVNRNNKALQFYYKMGMHISRSGDFDIGGGYFMNDHIMAIELTNG